MSYTKIVKKLTNKEIGAIFQGQLEMGPRALGNRSIIADPRMEDGKDKVNEVKEIILSMVKPTRSEEGNELYNFYEEKNNDDKIISFHLFEIYKNSAALDNYILNLNIPILGICYGHQILAKKLGGKIKISKIIFNFFYT